MISPSPALRGLPVFPAALLLRHIGCFTQQIAFEPQSSTRQEPAHV